MQWGYHSRAGHIARQVEGGACGWQLGQPTPGRCIRECGTMTAYNVVRMRVKPGRNEDYLEAHRAIGRDTFAGMKSVAIIQTGERDFCLIGEWDSMEAIVAARPTMIATLDRSREMLEDLGGDLGVTDPVSGEVVLEVHREMA
jgi:hypothetical protein